jgi:hypothetical protein
MGARVALKDGSIRPTKVTTTTSNITTFTIGGQPPIALPNSHAMLCRAVPLHTTAPLLPHPHPHPQSSRARKQQQHQHTGQVLFKNLWSMLWELPPC